MGYRVLFSNIGYAKGIDGSLKQHITRIGRHLYCNVPIQQEVLKQLQTIMIQEEPDLCCFVEIDQGSFHSGCFNQIHALLDNVYRFYDIADKYGKNSSMGKLPLYIGKSNGFLAKKPLAFERLYLSHGTKRLLYRLTLPDDVQLFFAHFSLNKKVRAQQFAELQKLVAQAPGEVIILADFNIMSGFDEIRGLIQQGDMTLMNNKTEHTFVFHKMKRVLDLCLCSKGLKDRLRLKVIPQIYSDHAALLIEY